MVVAPAGKDAQIGRVAAPGRIGVASGERRDGDSFGDDHRVVESDDLSSVNSGGLCRVGHGGLLGRPDNADAVMWLIFNVFTIDGLVGRDISLLRSQARRLAEHHEYPSIRAIAHLTVDGSEVAYSALIGDRTGDPADYDPIEGLRHASELARSVGAVLIDRTIANWLVVAMIDRGFASDAAWLRSSLDNMFQDRLSGMIPPMVAQIPIWFAGIGESNSAAVVVGYTDEHPESLQWVPPDRLAEARTLIDDLPERAALARAGAAMDLDQLVEYLLDEFDRIAAATAPSGEQTRAPN